LLPGSSIGSLPALPELGQGAGGFAMFYVYIIQSQKDGKLYTGFTSNIEKRIRAHNQGEVKSTRNRRPFKLVYQEEYKSKTEALKREKFPKSFKGGKTVKSKLNITPR